MTPPLATAHRVGRRRAARAAARLAGWLAVAAALASVAGGCGATPRVLAPDDRRAIDRRLVETPAGFDLELYAVGLDQPVDLAFDADGNLIVAEGGVDGSEPRVYGFAPDRDRTRFDLYPPPGTGPLDRLPLVPGTAFRMYGPVGGVLAHQGRVYVSHRDADGFGVITSLDYKGGARTIRAGLPARGEHGVTGMTVDPAPGGRLYFGVGSATNSGVAGEDDLAMGWVTDHPTVHDIPYTPKQPLVLLGSKFLSRNPTALWLAPDVANTGPFQPFNTSSKRRIAGATRDDPRCNAAIFSVTPDGGDLQLYAHGIRLPKALAFAPGGRYLFCTNQGMELRGSRPVKDDPDVLLRVARDKYYGWPDTSTDLFPITDARFQPPRALIEPSGYPDLSFLVNHAGSDLGLPSGPDARAAVAGVFPSQSGASGAAFAPGTGPLLAFSGSAFVALAGGRAPFATSGQPTTGPTGHKVVLVDPDTRQVRDFVRNVRPGPASSRGGGPEELERPVAVRVGPDGVLYVLDMGRMEVRDGRPRVTGGTGRIYRLLPSRPPAGS